MGGLRRFVWLASWPKSGNTWVRCLLANFMSEPDKPILAEFRKHVPGISVANRDTFDEVSGVLSSHCTDDEIESLRPVAFRYLAAISADEAEPVPFLFCKAHDCYHETASGGPLFPTDVTAGAVYLMRNPLDVAVSLAFHSGFKDMSESVGKLNGPATVGGGRNADQVRQRMWDWSTHVESWTGAPFPVLVLRYEDLLADAARQLAKLVRFLGLTGDDEDRIGRAVDFAAFTRLQEAEERDGFRERPPTSRRFFRSGRTGDWQRHLTAEQARSVLDAHGETMSKWGYDCEALLGELGGKKPDRKP